MLAFGRTLIYVVEIEIEIEITLGIGPHSSLDVVSWSSIRVQVDCDTDSYIEQYSCVNVSESWKLINARKSFPSGHSSLSVYSAVYLSVTTWSVVFLTGKRCTDTGQQTNCNNYTAYYHTTIKIVRLSVTVGDRGKRRAARGWLSGWLSSSQQQTLNGRAARVYTCTCVHDNTPSTRLLK